MADTDRFPDRLTSEVDHDSAGPRPGTVAAGVVAVVILLGAGAVALSGGPSPSTEPTASQSVASTTEAPPATAPVAVADPDAPDATQGPLLVAPMLDWQLFAGVPLPYSKTAGPSLVDGPLYRGYARSQTGALVAATHLATRYLLTPGQGWREVLDRQVLPGTGREIFARLRSTVDQARAGCLAVGQRDAGEQLPVESRSDQQRPLRRVRGV